MSFCLTSVSDGIGTSTFAAAKVQQFFDICKREGAFFGKIRQAWRIRETGEEAGRGLAACVFDRPCMVDTMEKRRRQAVLEKRRRLGVLRKRGLENPGKGNRRIRGLAETAARTRQDRRGEDGEDKYVAFLDKNLRNSKKSTKFAAETRIRML